MLYRTYSPLQLLPGVKLMHIAVCDDNVADRKQLERLLGRESDKRKHDTGVSFTDSYGQSSVLARNPMPYDLFFIDLTESTPDGLTFALSLCKAGVSAPMVLCSSKINYRARASEYEQLPSNLLFMDKPIKTADLSKVLDQAVVIQQHRTPTIELRSDIETYYVQEDDIVYAVSQGKYLDVYLKDGTKIPVISYMDNFYDQIAMYTHIVLLSRRTLCNIVYVDKYTPFKVTLKDGTNLKSSPFSLKYINWAMKMYQAETP